MDAARKTQSIDKLKQYIRKLQSTDRESFEKLLNIIKYSHNKKVDSDKYLTIKVAITEFKKSNGRRMSLEELADFCKLEFEDLKFIDIFVHFCKDPETGQEAHNMEVDPETGKVRDYTSDNCMLENPYTSYVSIDKIYKLYDILANLQWLVPGDQTFSHSSFMQMLNPDNSENALAKKETVKAIIDEEMGHRIRVKQDPYLQKLVEVIYKNIQSRFQVF